MYLDFDLGAVAEELDGMLELKVKVMLIGIGPKANFFQDSLLRPGLEFFLLLLLRVLELGVVDYLAHWWISVGRNLYQVQLLGFG